MNDDVKFTAWRATDAPPDDKMIEHKSTTFLYRVGSIVPGSVWVHTEGERVQVIGLVLEHRGADAWSEAVLYRRWPTAEGPDRVRERGNFLLRFQREGA